MELGLIGLGRMGANMARRLRRANVKLAAYNRNPEVTLVASRGNRAYGNGITGSACRAITCTTCHLVDVTCGGYYTAHTLISCPIYLIREISLLTALILFTRTPCDVLSS